MNCCDICGNDMALLNMGADRILRCFSCANSAEDISAFAPDFMFYTDLGEFYFGAGKSLAIPDGATPVPSLGHLVFD